MRIAFIVGFFDPVRAALNQCYPESVYRDRILWIASGSNVVATFKGRFYDVLRTAEGILVCVGASGNQQNLVRAIEGIIGTGAMSNPNTPVSVERFGNLFDGDPIVDCVKAFGVETQPLIDTARVRERIPSGRILCVSPAGKTSIKVALERAGFSAEALNDCFDEEVCPAARNSNLMRDLETRANAYVYLLYAWEGLRTSTAEVKKKFTRGCLEARSAAQVVEMFRKWITEGD